MNDYPDFQIDEEELNPLEALGLHRVGQPLPQRPNLPTPPPLNKRGMVSKNTSYS